MVRDGGLHCGPSRLSCLHGMESSHSWLRRNLMGDGSGLPDLGEDTLIAASTANGGNVPGGWLLQQLDDGRAIIFFDGLDEVPETRINDALRWIDRLQRRYPRVGVVVTARVEGLDRAWFEKRDFTILMLEPMRFETIRACVGNWYDAVLSYATSSVGADFEASRERLLRDVLEKPVIQVLASAPLLCAMLCAYYAQGFNEAPGSRADLLQECDRRPCRFS